MMTLRESLTQEERPRERLARLGAHSLTDAELLALLIGSGVRGRHAIAVANDILEQCGGLRGLQQQSVQQLKTNKGLGPARASMLTAAFELGTRASLAQLKTGQSLTRSADVKQYCRRLLSNLTVEHCAALLLDTQHRLIHCEEISRGTLTQAPIYVREVVKLALKHHASGLILAHNHPSGLAKPSADDLALTKELAHALHLVDVTLLDHLVVAGPQAASLAELGYL
jgi:DNA repair protein RadC